MAKHTIPDDQWDLPAAIAEGGSFISLRDFTKRRPQALSFSQLTLSQRAELTAIRIQKQPKFELAMVGAGIVTKEQAVAAVRAQTEVGRTLMEIEERVILDLLREIEAHGPAKVEGTKAKSR